MYMENEKLILVKGVGKEGDEKYIPAGTEVTFVKAIDYDLKSYVVVQFGDRILTIPELAVKPTVTDSIAVLKAFNDGLIKNSPELGVYHHNVIIRIYYKIKLFLKKILTKKQPSAKIKQEDLDNLKKFINDHNEED